MNIYKLSLALIALPVGLIIREIFKERNRKQAQEMLAQAYARLVREYKLSIDHVELFGKKVFAMDKINKKLVLVDHGGAHHIELCIPLMQIGSSKINEVRDNLENGIRKVFLELKYKRSGKLVRFCFYDEQEDSLDQLKKLTRRATHWKNRVDTLRFSDNVTADREYVL